jgi:hypothetical protein
LEVTQTTYETLKKRVQGFYWKFNENVLKWHMNKMFDYEYLLETAKEYETFTEFYNFHTSKKQEIIDEHVEQMFDEATRKGLNPTKELVKNCVVVRLGNVYTGMSTENKIINTFSTLAPYITCEKTAKEIDTQYKVDGIIELQGIDKLAIQIKPISFTKYDKGSEKQNHERFKIEFGPRVYYVFYKDKNNISFNGKDIRLDNKNEIINQIEKILVY